MSSQVDFVAALLDADQAVPAGLVNPDASPATKRFDVYRNNVAVSLTEALEAVFPVVRKLVGDEFFTAMAGVYLRLHPPASPMMMHYGAQMPQFLRRFPPAKTVPYLSDIARVELALRRAYHAADDAPLAGDALSAIAPGALMLARFGFASAVTVVTSTHPIHDIYRANTDPDAPPPGQVGQGGQAVLVSRAGFDPQVHGLNVATASFIEALMARKTLGEVVAFASDDLDIGATFGLLLGQGALTELT
jgi:hypothetical protein